MTLEALFQLEDTARARATDPDTSHEAAEAASPHVWESQLAALKIMRGHGKPMTALQIEDVAAALDLPFSRSRMRSTPSELAEKGEVELVGRTHPATGRGRQLWRIVPCSCGNPDPGWTRWGRMCARCERDFFAERDIHD